MKKIIRIRLEIMITAAIIFCASFIPEIDALHSIFFYPATDFHESGNCTNGFCNKNSAHFHWTFQHFIWTFTGVVLVIVQVIHMVEKHVES